MKLEISEKDKKLLLILAAVAVICLPKFFLTDPLSGKLDALQQEVAQLEAKDAELSNMQLMQAEYAKEAEWYTEEKERLYDKFPPAFSQEREILFIDQTEKRIPISLYQVSFGEDTATQTTSASEAEAAAVEAAAHAAETGSETSATETAAAAPVPAAETSSEVPVSVGTNLSVLSSKTQFTYDAGYEELKKFLEYILNHDDRMVITDFTASFAEDLNLVNGNFSMTKYAVLWDEKENVVYHTPNRGLGTTNIFRQASGIGYTVEEKAESDFFLMLNQPDADRDAFMVGQTLDTEENNLLTLDENAKQEITITFTGKEGAYNAQYRIGETQISEEGIDFTTDQNIYFEVLSSARSSEDDQVETNLNIINKTDIRVNVNIQNDDKEKPRVVIKGKTGDIFLE